MPYLPPFLRPRAKPFLPHFVITGILINLLTSEYKPIFIRHILISQPITKHVFNMEMSKADQIQIGMLGVIIVLLLLNFSGVFGPKDVSLASDVKQELAGNTPNAYNPAANPTSPVAAPPASQPAAPVATGPTTIMDFAQTEFDFGTVNEGEIVKRTFKFKNTGKEPLIISNAQGSCGCTVPKWPREPIAPGGSGEIVVEFNSTKKAGKRNQQVTITANTEPAQTQIRLVGTVTPAAGGDANGGVAPITMPAQ